MVGGLLLLGLISAISNAQNWPQRIASAIVLVGIVALFIALLVYPTWAQIRRFRALDVHDVDTMPGHEFEQYVALLLEDQGFRTTVTQGSGDLGVDVIADKNATRYAVQCKRYNSNVSRTAVSDAVAGMRHYGCTHAMVVTNQYFTLGAIQLANSNRCVLVDRDRLAEWVSSFQKTQSTKSVASGGPNVVP